MMSRWFLALLLLAIIHPAFGAELTPERINGANFTGKLPSGDGISPLAVKLQALLDRARFSPGEIDGRFGDNVEKALQAFAEANNLASGKVLTPEIWSKLQQGSSDAIIAHYVLTDKDIKGPYIEKLPAKMEDMKSLKALSYTGPKQAPSKTARVEVDKSRETVRAFASDGTLLAFYPASIGSEEKPTPSGTLKVVSIEPNPTYRYDPKYKFKGVESTKPFTINAGPNNPVGTMWIGLSQAGYGIHGTNEPSRVSKSESHGCVRLTNWDVARLAQSLKKGVEVSFVEGKQASR
jgi:lipoprotein-anchoring transpeptidase ErfK/SrfK